jgi:hypothetical protein
MKRCALSLLSACLGVAVLLLAAGCVDAMRSALTQQDILSGDYRAEAWNEHTHYYAGEKVRMRVTLTNLSRDPQIWGDTKGITPVVDIRVFSIKQPDGQVEELLWSQEHPGEVKYNVTLKPGESYVVKWEFTPSLLAHYYAYASYINPKGDYRLGLSFWYGVEPPGPGP